VTRIEPHDSGIVVHVEDGQPIQTRALLLACPAFVTGDLLRGVDAELAGLCGAIKYLSTATVVFAFPREAVKNELRGTGFVVPGAEGLNITAGTWISSKWPQRAPETYALLRAFLGGARDPGVLARTDRELAEIALREMSTVLGIHGTPEFSRVYRWSKSSPQLEVGHLELMAKIDAHLAHHPGLFVSAAGLRGVGIPDCIADGRATAAQVATWTVTRPPCLALE
jgi:oxygen-dependent protoporphyrinogen oxidase